MEATPASPDPPRIMKKSIFLSGLWFSHPESLVGNGKFQQLDLKKRSEANGIE